MKQKEDRSVLTYPLCFVGNKFNHLFYQDLFRLIPCFHKVETT